MCHEAKDLTAQVVGSNGCEIITKKGKGERNKKKGEGKGEGAKTKTEWRAPFLLFPSPLIFSRWRLAGARGLAWWGA